MHLLCDIPLSINGKTHGLLGSGPSFVTQTWMKKKLLQSLCFSTNFELSFEGFSIILKLGFSMETSAQQSLVV